MAHVTIAIHGMITTPDPVSHQAEYAAMRDGLKKAEPSLTDMLDHRFFGVEWGHVAPGQTPSVPDQAIFPAENKIGQQVAYKNVEQLQEPGNHLHGGHEGVMDWLFKPLRPVFRDIKENVAIYGLTDVVYYCSEDGEANVRERVYGEVLHFLDALPLPPEEEIQLHVIGHSLGCTVAFDFLFGLFYQGYKNNTPDFAKPDYPADEGFKLLYKKYRIRADAGTLKLGSLSMSASQLPLLVMRRQRLVEQLARGELLDIGVIGVTPGNGTKVATFYDQDDLLGFPTRSLFADRSRMEEWEVNTGYRPDAAHSAYWSNPDVLRQIARVMKGNM